MTYSKELIAAIDIGTTKIVAVAGKINPQGKIEILGMERTASKGVKRGVIHSIEETIDAIREVSRKLQEKLGQKIYGVYVGIAGQHIRSIKNRQFKYIQNDISEITRQDVQDILNENYRIPIEVGEQILHVIPQDYVVDKEAGIRNPVGMAGRRMDGNFNIIIGRTASARNIEKCVKEVGLEIEELILEPLASSEAVLTEEEKEAGVVLVDIGGGTTDITVYFDGILRHTAVIPFGGDMVTRDIKEGCSVLIKQAEALKVQFGEAVAELADEEKVVTIPSVGGWDPKEISFKTLAFIIQCRMEEIIDSVKFQVEITGLHDKIGAGIVLTGGGAMLKNLALLTGEKTGLDVRIGYPNASGKIIVEEDINQPMYATGMGLLIKGLEKPYRVPHVHANETDEPVKKKGLKRFFGALFDTQDVEM
ncbi:MAG: cell division protein FtsA [Marinifilaceae bacterium]|jgi:cell division protein FtsA